MKETYEWAKEKMAQWSGLTREAQDISKDGVKTIATPPYARFENQSFHGDVAKQDSDLFFHFFPTTNPKHNIQTEDKTEWMFSPRFASCLADSFLAVFKYEDRLFWDYVTELRSWVVRCAGFGSNPLSDTLVENVLVQLKLRYEIE